jgi:hypothetical protein
MSEDLIEYLHERHPVTDSLLDEQPLRHLEVAADPLHERLFGIHDAFGGGGRCQAEAA